METENKATVMITLVFFWGGGGDYKFGANTPKIITAGHTEEREARSQQESERQRLRRVAENPV